MRAWEMPAVLAGPGEARRRAALARLRCGRAAHACHGGALSGGAGGGRRYNSAVNLLSVPSLALARRRCARIGVALFLGLWLAGAAQAQQRYSTGTGFFVTDDGYFLTCFHVVVNSGAISVRNLKGETWAARAVAVDRVNDLALLKVENAAPGTRFAPLPLAPSGEVRRGTAIVTMGFPNVNLQGIEPKVTDGIVNSFSGANNDPRLFQISSPIQPGNSGGPLISMEGNVIGIISSKLDAAAIARQTGDIPQNVNYAIKSQYALDLLGKQPGLQARLAPPLRGEKARVVDVVPALEEAVVLVLAAPAGQAEAAAARAPEAAVPSPTPAPGAGPRAPLPAPERNQRLNQIAEEYRQLRQSLNSLQFNELALFNQARMMQLMPGAAGAPGQGDLQQIQKRLDELGTRKAEVIKRMNELAAEFRQLQESPA